MPRYIVYLVIAAGLLTGSVFADSPKAKPESGWTTVNEYLDLVISGNYQSAEQYWLEEPRRRADRFGIEYIDIPLKIDCSSPIIRNPELAAGKTQMRAQGQTSLDTDEFSRYLFEVPAGEERLRHHYYTWTAGGYYWLTFAQDYFSRNWPVTQTKYFRVHYHPDMERYLNPIVLEQVDRFVEDIGHAIGLSGKDLELIEREKVDYFYCHNDGMVRDMTGHSIKGTYDLASDDIISAFFPHYHEITHFLINLKLRRQHMYILPIMREGAAVLYGGRWGKAPTSLLTLGGNIYRQEVLDLDSILTMAGFEASAGADLAYPVAGLFAGFVIENKGSKSYLELYRQLSGGFGELAEMTADDVRAIMIEKLGARDWGELRTRFDEYIDGWLRTSAGLYPGEFEQAETILQTDGLLVGKHEDWITVTATFAKDSLPTGNLLFGYDSTLASGSSSLFDQQYRFGEQFEGYRYGVRFDRAEAGVYDYATNTLVAKYISGMAPSDDYYSETDNKVTLKFKADVVGGKLPSESDFKLLRN
ncbi:MAG: hypothetical protein JSU74_07005 [Candidatus Zixiibacteriota bacterium]|nr:MAG: hypothetical protein JSU74_07005 [candidate division Zixibacteria bacterium]